MAFVTGTWGEVFELAVETEIKAIHFYDGLTLMFQNFPLVADCWKRMADDEQEHANILNQIQKNLSMDILLAPADHLILYKARANMKFTVDSMLSSVQNLDDAYELAHDLEFSEADAVFCLLATHFIDQQDKKNFILAQINEHQYRIEHSPEIFRTKSWRSSIAPIADPTPQSL